VASLFLLPSALFAQATPAQATLARTRITQPIDETNLVTLKGNMHPLARPEYDRGAAPDSQPMNRALLLLQRSPEQETALRQLLDAQQSNSSPQFHQWLTPAQFGQQFGPSDADIATITTWLQSKGFSVNRISQGRTVIEISGTAGQIRNAFHTEIHQYVVNGESHWANATDPEIPAALAPVVAGFAALNNFPVKSYLHPLGTFQKSAATGEVTPTFTFPGCRSGTCYAVGPADFATIYNTAPLLSGSPKIDGTGQTIAVVGESDINVQDIIDFRTMFGLPQNFSSANIILDGPDPGINSSEGESALDVEWTGGVAPGATIDFVTSQSTETTGGIFLSDIYIVDNNLASVMSESFGGCEQEIGTLNQFHNSLWEQAAAQGITVLLSAGDAGSANCDNFNTESTATMGLAVSGFASTPFDIAVGGTDFDDSGTQSTYWNTSSTPTSSLPIPSSALSYIPEVPWNDSCAQGGLTGCLQDTELNIVAGSGGVSTLYQKPSWQSATGVPKDGARDLPDVSLFASNGFNSSFYIMCQSDATSPPTRCNLTNFGSTFRGVGGTSVSVQAFAGIMALVNQKYGRQGNANYVLYGLARAQQGTTNLSCNSSSAPNSACTFYDVTKGSNSVPCAGLSPNCSSTFPNLNGVLVETSSPNTPAYPATAGYDLATGLGTVNVQNLVANWPNVTLIGSSTALTFNNNSTVSITHGASVPVAFSVTPSAGSGTPTGDVSLIGTMSGGNSLGFGEFTLGSNATVTGNTTSLAGGTYTLSAHYAGDAVYAPSNSSGVNVTVTPEASKVLVSVPVFDSSGLETGNSPTSLMYGSGYIARIDVGNSQATLSYPPKPACNPPTCPTGTITWTDSLNGVAPVPLDGGSFTLNSEGFAEDQPIMLLGGTHVLTANYPGDDSYAASTGTYTLNVTPAYDQIAIPIVQPTFNRLVGTPINISTSISPYLQNGAPPTGTVTFYDGSTPLQGTASYVSVVGNLSASLNTVFTSSGTHSITARYSGDADYAAITSAATQVSVYWPDAISQALSPNNINYGQSVTAMAKVTGSSQGPALAGQFTFNATTPINGPVTVTSGVDGSGNPVLTAMVATTPQGSEQIQVTYSGDPNYGSLSTSTFVNVVIPDFSLPANGVSATVTAGQTTITSFTITPLSNSPSSVTFNQINASQPGTTITFNPSTVNLNGIPVQVMVTVATTGPSAGQAMAAIARTRRGRIFPTPRIGAWPLAMAVAMLSGFLLMFPTRRRGLRAALFCFLLCAAGLGLACGGGGGGSSGGGGGSGGSTPVPTSLAIQTSNAKVPALTAGTFTLSATVTSTQPVTGNVTFVCAAAGVSSGPIPVVNSGASFLSNWSNTAGTYAITAMYSGDSNNQASQSATPLNEVFTGGTSVVYSAQTGGVSHNFSVLVTLQ